MYKEKDIQPNEKILRQKYVRVLEKFVKRAINLLKHPEFDFEVFKKQSTKFYAEVSKVEKIRLNNGYLKKLEEYSGHILNTLEYHSEDFKEEHEFLLKEANLLHKEKNKASYKKDKYKSKSFNDGY
ncbi:MAG: hypothetical protein U9N30_02875 [Campylobacterota bacterium]|nr:hypothetical protein [Campylobacterota bacterium]